MFCTIEDAWGSKDSQHSSFANNNPDKSINTDNTFNKEMFEKINQSNSATGLTTFELQKLSMGSHWRKQLLKTTTSSTLAGICRWSA